MSRQKAVESWKKKEGFFGVVISFLFVLHRYKRAHATSKLGRVFGALANLSIARQGSWLMMKYSGTYDTSRYLVASFSFFSRQCFFSSPPFSFSSFFCVSVCLLFFLFFSFPTSASHMGTRRHPPEGKRGGPRRKRRNWGDEDATGAKSPKNVNNPRHSLQAACAYEL